MLLSVFIRTVSVVSFKQVPWPLLYPTYVLEYTVWAGQFPVYLFSWQCVDRNIPLCLCVQWVPEITHHCPKTPFLLVGTQIDLRDDPSTIEKLAKNKQKPITPETAEKLARDLKAVKYVECSALTQVIHMNKYSPTYLHYLKTQFTHHW